MTDFLIYNQFINYLKHREKNGFNSGEEVEKHHILPFHDGGNKKSEVVVYTPKNHCLAHYYRYLSYGQIGDKVCFMMRQNQITSLKDRAFLAVEKNKSRKNLFWNSSWKSQQGKKGEKVGGRTNTIKQKTQRQLLGNHFGKKTGIANQKVCLKQTLNRRIIWKYERNNLTLFEILPPFESFVDLVVRLNMTSPKTSFINIGPFYKVINGKRKQMYGWSLWFIYLK
jgi:hypothetical protein